jgi:hypothetical protein
MVGCLKLTCFASNFTYVNRNHPCGIGSWAALCGANISLRTVTGVFSFFKPTKGSDN